MRILCNILVLLFVTTAAVGQQINPVPDYIFRNQMSVGRNAATDTAAYLSIGPRFGATKGFQPPMVVDTASFSGSKRNGLTIFSVQRNKYVYWDSIGAKWAEMAGTAGNALTSADTANLLSTRAWRQKGDDSLGALIGLRVRYTDTASMLTPYLRKTDTTAMLTPYVRTAGYGLTKGTQTLSVDTGLMATRLRVQNAIDSLAATEVSGSGTVNRVAKFTASGTIGNGSISDSSSSVRMTIFNNGRIGVNTTTDAGFQFDVAGSMRSTGTATVGSSSGGLVVGATTSPSLQGRIVVKYQGGINFENQAATGTSGYLESTTSDGLQLGNNNAALLLQRVSGNFIFNSSGSGDVIVGTSTDAGAYRMQVEGATYFNGALNFGPSANIIQTTGNTALIFGTNSVARWRFTGAGLMQNEDTTTYIEFRRSSDNQIGSRIWNTWKTAEAAGALSILNNSGQTSEIALFGGRMLFYTNSTDRGRINADGEWLLGYTADQGAYILQANGNALINGNIRTAAPAGGTANDWRLGTVATVSPTSPNRTIEVSIGGTIYYIHAKTTND